MSFLQLIEAKRDGNAFTREMMNEAVAGFMPGAAVPEYQLGAFLMALFLRGMTPEEVPLLSFALRDSGTVLRFPDDPRPVVDKHSTGGVGDKVTLPLVPLLACVGFRVPMVSGRGLGITGGTLDKLESIPGFNVTMGADRIVEVVQAVGGVICGETGELAPADDVMYALRDVTGTVDSIPVTTASILSKKLAEGLDALVLDAKFGSAAMTQNPEHAEVLAQAMVDLGNACGVKTRALMTAMDAPLGRSAGNWLEVVESVACLENRGPDDLRAVVVECAASLLEQTGLAGDMQDGRRRALECLASEAPRAKWDEVIAAHGADIDTMNRKLQNPDTAPVIRELKADRSGFVSRLDARKVGEVVRDLGAGRFTKVDTLDYDVGVDCLKKPGETIWPGSLLARIHARTGASADDALVRLAAAFVFSDEPPAASPLIVKIIR